MQYWVYMKQAGHGCDYTVACGESFRLIEGATSMGDAQQKVIQQLLCPNQDPSENNRHYIDGDRELESLLIVAVDGIKAVDLLGAWRDRDQSYRDQLVSEIAVEVQERAEFERLKAKFGQ